MFALLNCQNPIRVFPNGMVESNHYSGMHGGKSHPKDIINQVMCLAPCGRGRTTELMTVISHDGRRLSTVVAKLLDVIPHFMDALVAIKRPSL